MQNSALVATSDALSLSRTREKREKDSNKNWPWVFGVNSLNTLDHEALMELELKRYLF